eukprot:TRINITY_DN68301_c0_g1_i1.p1 TRINITY_DN68301_c0_g1~~TRINITY_DN68301_c0_g1_i1.p1  ORF type:complete len:507 (+),score=63.70 TRINITY_DN68301_c0_g1_i1:184-1704(+)
MSAWSDPDNLLTDSELASLSDHGVVNVPGDSSEGDEDSCDVLTESDFESSRDDTCTKPAAPLTMRNRPSGLIAMRGSAGRLHAANAAYVGDGVHAIPKQRPSILAMKTRGSVAAALGTSAPSGGRSGEQVSLPRCVGCRARGLSECVCKRYNQCAAPVKDCRKRGLDEMRGSSELIEAQEEAREGRDRIVNGESLVSLWREASKPRKEGAIQPMPAGSKADFFGLFREWLERRWLSDALVQEEDQQGWHIFRYTKEPVVRSEESWEVAYHGTWWYSVWLILQTGIFLPSDDMKLGHDFWEPGVYCSPNLETGLWYARPHVLFGDGVYYRIIFEVRVDLTLRKRERKRGGVQWVFPSSAIALHRVWIRSNAPPANGEERVREWEPHLEGLPRGWNQVPAVVNPRDLRTSPWPNIYDPSPWDMSGSSAPPWMRTPAPGPVAMHASQQEPKAMANAPSTFKMRGSLNSNFEIRPRGTLALAGVLKEPRAGSSEEEDEDSVGWDSDEEDE